MLKKRKCPVCKILGGRDACGFTGAQSRCRKCKAAYDSIRRSRQITPNESPEETAKKFKRLIDLVQRPIAVVELCNRLDLSPRRVHELLLQAVADGIKVHVENDHVGLKLAKPLERVQEIKISPVIGKMQYVGTLSDTHLGSKYCLRDQIKDHVHRCYDAGVREIVHGGDVLDGDYHHGKFEMTHMGIHDQTRDLFETLPKLPGLTYHAITGNHDHTFTSSSGVDAGEFMVGYFRKRGRNDLNFYGNRGAYVKIRGALIHLWHPRSGGSYAVSYGLQKKIEGYSAIKPQIMLAGHWHTYCAIDPRGVQAIAMPCFQAGQSEFSKSMTKAPSIGGLVLGWTITRDGSLRDFHHQKRGYWEIEKPLNIYNALDGEGVENLVTEVTTRRSR